MENLLSIKENNQELYNKLFNYNCKVTYNNRVIYEGLFNEDIDLGKYNKSQIVYDFTINENHILILAEENKNIETLYKLFENKEFKDIFEDAKLYNKSMNLANKLPLYNLNEDELIKSYIKKHGINLQKIYENLLI